MKPMVSVLRPSGLVLVSSIILVSCAYIDVPRQQQRLEATCRIQGSVQVAGTQPEAIVILLLRKIEESGDAHLDHTRYCIL